MHSVLQATVKASVFILSTLRIYFIAGCDCFPWGGGGLTKVVVAGSFFQESLRGGDKNGYSGHELTRSRIDVCYIVYLSIPTVEI